MLNKNLARILLKQKKNKNKIGRGYTTQHFWNARLGSKEKVLRKLETRKQWTTKKSRRKFRSNLPKQPVFINDELNTPSVINATYK